ncbi:hypothetical protein [Anaerococcus ihuae]|uniref:hypothetical protein n=1 Tax=Anaerococcus ihuae TaxID=2899519 RepID=UPI001F35A4B6|nr:hypothetical protein [Anaerococcus ihuae]
MKDFINIFEINDEFIKEYASARLNRKIFNAYNRILCVLLIIFGLILIIFPIKYSIGPDLMFIGISDIIVSLILFIGYVINFKKYTSTMKARIEILGKNIKEVKNEIHDNLCITTNNIKDRSYEILLSFLDDHFESKNYYFLIFSGDILVTFKKNGFIKGDYIEFENFLAKYPKKKNTRALILGVCLTLLILINLKYLINLYKYYLIF